MNWDQIEVKWAEMAKRVRSDAPERLPLESAGNEMVLLSSQPADMTLPEVTKTPAG
jgi:hypothetical protein